MYVSSVQPISSPMPFIPPSSHGPPRYDRTDFNAFKDDDCMIVLFLTKKNLLWFCNWNKKRHCACVRLCSFRVPKRFWVCIKFFHNKKSQRLLLIADVNDLKALLVDSHSAPSHTWPPANKGITRNGWWRMCFVRQTPLWNSLRLKITTSFPSYCV